MSDDKRSTALAPLTFGEVQSMAKYLQGSNLLPAALKGKEADVAMTIAAGQELGLAPMAALRAVHIVGGKPILSADAMVAIVLHSGLAEYFTMCEGTDDRATYETRRRGISQPVRATFTMADAQRALLLGRGGKGEDNWSKYPTAMLRARAKSQLAREVYPDVLMGVYSEAEADEVVGSSGFQAPSQPAAPAEEGAIDAVLVEDIEVLRAAIESAQSVGDLEALMPRIKELNEEERQAIRGPYRARKRELEEAQR